VGSWLAQQAKKPRQGIDFGQQNGIYIPRYWIMKGRYKKSLKAFELTA
jgi:hypothetical protein